MHLSKKSFLFIILLFLIFSVQAQTFEYGLKYDGIGDNREFFSPYSQAETFMGSRLGFDVGASIDSVNKFRAGFSYFYEFGSELWEQKTQLILYYSIDKGPWGFKMGAFPRKENIILPHAIISEKYEYFNPTVDGLLVKYKGNKGNINLFVDWVSRQDSTRREQFMAGLFGKQKPGNFILEEYWYMFHNAGRIIREPGVNMEDYMGACLLAGYDFSGLVPLDILTVKTGVLISSYRNRGTTMDYNFKPSSYSEIVADYKGYGVEAFLKFGNEHEFSKGDLFYQNAKNYIRTRLYFTPINFDRVKGRFMWSLHFANGDLDNQQQFSLVYYLNSL